MAAERLENRPCGGRYGDIVAGDRPHAADRAQAPVAQAGRAHLGQARVAQPDRLGQGPRRPGADRGRRGEGPIRPGQTILEPTSGNTGISLAMICARKGYPLKVVMPDNVTPERTAAAADVRRRDRLLARAPRAPTAPSSWRSRWPQPTPPTTCPTSTGTRPTRSRTTTARRSRSSRSSTRSRAFVAGLGTGGTLMGNGRRLKEELGDACKIVAAEPMQGEPVQGLRSLDDGFIPPIIDLVAARPQDLRHQPRRDRLDAQAARRGGPLRRRLDRGDRPRRGADRRRARRGQRRLHRRRRRLEVPLVGHLHAAARGGREPRLHRLVVDSPRRPPARRGALRHEEIVRIPRTLYDADRRRTRSPTRPTSAAGLSRARGGEAVRVIRCANTAASPLRYEIDSQELFRDADRRSRTPG